MGSGSSKTRQAVVKIDKVMDGLYISGVVGAGRRQRLKSLGVTHVLCLPNLQTDAYFPEVRSNQLCRNVTEMKLFW